MRRKRIMMVMIFTLIVLCIAPSAALAADTPAVIVDTLMAPGGSGMIRIALNNSDAIDHSYKLEVKGLDDGFSVYFSANGSAADTILIPSSSSVVAELNIEAPAELVQDSYIFTIDCVRDDGETVSLPSQITINSDYTINITSDTNQIETLNGKSISVDIAVTNTGNKQLSDISITPNLPYKWVAESVMPDKISLMPGESGVFKVSVMIPTTQGAGSSEISFSAGNTEVQSKTLTIPVKVSANANFAFIIIGCVAVAGLVTVIYFRRHGRR